jgi:hypothetical protein
MVFRIKKTSKIAYAAHMTKLEIVGLDDDLKFTSEVKSDNTTEQTITEAKNVNSAAMTQAADLAAALEGGKTPIITTLLGNRYEVRITLKNVGTEAWKEKEVWLVGSRNPKTWSQRASDTGSPDNIDLDPESTQKNFPSKLDYWTALPIWPPPYSKVSAAAKGAWLTKAGGYSRSGATTEKGESSPNNDYNRGITDLIKRANGGKEKIEIKGLTQDNKWSILPGKTYVFKFIIKMPDGPPIFKTEWQATPTAGTLGDDASWRPQLLMAQLAIRVPGQSSGFGINIPWGYADIDSRSLKEGEQKDPSTSTVNSNINIQENYSAATKNPIQFAMTPVHSDAAAKGSAPKIKKGAPGKPSKGSAPKCLPTETPYYNEKSNDQQEHKWECVCKPSLKRVKGKCVCTLPGYEFKTSLNNGLGACTCPKTTHILEGSFPTVKCIKLTDIVDDLKCDPTKKEILDIAGSGHYTWTDCEKAWKSTGKEADPGQLMCQPGDCSKKGKCGQCVPTVAKNTSLKTYNQNYPLVNGVPMVPKGGAAAANDPALKEIDEKVIMTLYCASKNAAGNYKHEGKPCTSALEPDFGFGQVCGGGKCGADNPKSSFKLGAPSFSGIGYNDYFLNPQTIITSGGLEDKDTIRLLLNAIWKQTTPSFSEFGKAFPDKYRASKIYQKWSNLPTHETSKQSFTSYYLASMKQSKFFAALDDKTIAEMGAYDELSRVVELYVEEDTYRISFGDSATKIGLLNDEVETAINELSDELGLNGAGITPGSTSGFGEIFIKNIIKNLDSKIHDKKQFEDFNFNLKPLTLPHGHHDIKLQKMDIRPNYYYHEEECDKMDKKKDETSLFFAYKNSTEPKKIPSGGLRCASPHQIWDTGKKILFKQHILNMLTKEAEDQLAGYPIGVGISIPTPSFYSDKKISNQQINKEASSAVKNILGKAGLAVTTEKELLLKKFMSYYGREMKNDKAPSKPYYRSSLRANPDKISLRYIESSTETAAGYEGQEPVDEKRVVTFAPATTWDSDVMADVPDDDINAVDAAFNIKNQNRTIVHFFQGENWYTSTGITGTSTRTIDVGFPKKISNHWPPQDHINEAGPGTGMNPKGTIPNDPDAVLHIPPEIAKIGDFSNPILFFKGLKMWIYEYDMQKIAWSGDIKTAIPGLPSGVDSAFIWPNNKGIYLFKGKQYWRLESETLEIMPEYPRLIAGDKDKGYDGWGITLRDIGAVFVDAAGDTVLFKGHHYYILDSAGAGHTKKWSNNGSDKGWDIATYWKTPDLQGISKIKNRTWEDIKDGKFANFEVIGYRIIKHRDAPTEDLPIGKDEIQSYFVPYDEASDIIKILDTQVKYDTPYYYSAMAVLIVYGNFYSYSFLKDQGSVVPLDSPAGKIPNITFKVNGHTASRMLEVPLVHSKEQTPTRVLAEPPMPPLLHIYSYKGVNDELLLDFEKGLGYNPKKVLLTYEKQQVDEWKRIRDSIEQSSTPLDIATDEMIFSGNSKVKKFLFYRLEDKPEKIQDFLNVDPIEIPIENTLYRDKIIPNKKYYNASRSKDVYGVMSYLGDPFQVEIVDDGGAIFAIIEPFYIKEKKEKIEKHFKKKIRIRPAFLQAAPNKDRIKPTQDERVVGHLEETVFTESSEGNLFKIRVTSKKTNRKIDLNIRFVQEKLKVNEKGYPENDAKNILTWEQD